MDNPTSMKDAAVHGAPPHKCHCLRNVGFFCPSPLRSIVVDSPLRSSTEATYCNLEYHKAHRTTIESLESSACAQSSDILTSRKDDAVFVMKEKDAHLFRKSEKDAAKRRSSFSKVDDRRRRAPLKPPESLYQLGAISSCEGDCLVRHT